MQRYEQLSDKTPSCHFDTHSYTMSAFASNCHDDFFGQIIKKQTNGQKMLMLVSIEQFSATSVTQLRTWQLVVTVRIRGKQKPGELMKQAS